MAVFPLILHVQQRTGSAFAVSALFFALWGPVVLGAGLAGAIVDRFENRALLIGVSFAPGGGRRRRSSLSVDTLWALLPLWRCSASASRSSQPAEFALVPAAAGEARTSRAPTG